MAQLKAVLFDLDGTLIDTAPDFIYVVNELLAQDKLPPLDQALIRATVSDGSRALIRLAYQLEEDDAKIEPLRQRLLSLYENNIATHSRPFAGINDLLAKLAENNIVWGISTNKPEFYTSLLMAQLRMDPPPAIVLSPDQVPNAKPAPDSLFIACDAIGCNVNEAVYIGDHLRDIDCGRNAGMPTIAAAYGYIPPGQSASEWKADHIIDHADEIWPLLQEFYLD